jgi:UDPglucose 6-dehydrogenase
MANPIVIDLRNIYDPEELAKEGFVYDSVGRANGGGSNGRASVAVTAKTSV